MVPRPEVLSDDPFDRSPAGQAYWREAAAIEEWIEAGAPSPLELWLERDGVPSQPPAPQQPPDPNTRGLLSREEAAYYCGGVSLDTFDRHVRHNVKTRMVGARPFYSVESLRAFCASDAYKSLS